MWKYRVIVTESERGWGQKTSYKDFDTPDAAEKFRDNLNKDLGVGPVPDWYMIADDQILTVKV